MAVATPTIVGIVAAVAAMAAAAASAYQQHQAGKTQEKVLKYQSRQAQNQAIAARQAAEVRAQQERKRLDALRATTRARAAASGVDSTEGSPLLVMLENARQAQYEEELIRYGGDVEASALNDDARLRLFQGKTARRSANITAGTTLLAGVASAASSAAGAYRGPSAPASAGHSMGTHTDSVYGR